MEDILNYINAKHPHMRMVVENYRDQDLAFRYEEMGIQPGTVDWCIMEMKRLLLVTQCKKDLVEFFNRPTPDSEYCQWCNVLFHYDSRSSDRICKQCGVSRHYVSDENYTFNERNNYNQNPVHRYTPAEHFGQTICDFCGIGQRTVPSAVMDYCRVALGRGTHVTSEKVFNVLRSNGYRAFYMHKYEIANRLRGVAEFSISSREIERMRDIYKVYHHEFMAFQQLHKIGSFSRRGKLRLYWPMRFILAKMCEQIGRGDLTVFIRKVSGKKRLEEYTRYWGMLQHEVESRHKISSGRPTSEIEIFPLKKTRHLQ